MKRVLEFAEAFQVDIMNWSFTSEGSYHVMMSVVLLIYGLFRDDLLAFVAYINCSFIPTALTCVVMHMVFAN